jgi:hypothetical protein
MPGWRVSERLFVRAAVEGDDCGGRRVAARRGDRGATRLPGMTVGCGSWSARDGVSLAKPNGLRFEWGETVLCESEADDPFEQALELRLVGERLGDVRLAVVGGASSGRGGGVARSEFSLDDHAIAVR